MTDTREDEESPSGNHLLDARPTTGGPWNPLASFRKTISATQRMELLRMKIPVLPPEDFMDTADFQRARTARSRRFLPLAVGIGAGLLLLLFAGLRAWLWSPPPHREASSQPTPGAVPSEQPPRSSVSIAPPIAIDPPRAAVAPSPSVSSHPASGDAAQVAKVATPSNAVPPSRPPVEANPNPRSVPRSMPAAPQPKTTAHPNAEPAPSGINFWTQPR